MRLHVLGSSGGYPRPDNPSSGYLLDGPGGRLWLDAGTGTFAVLQRLTDFTALDAVVLSHLHADHCLDLYPFYYALRFAPDGGWGSERRMPVYAPPGARETLAHLLAPDDAATFARVLDFRAIDQGTAVEAAGLRLAFLRTQHPIHTLAVRAEAPGGGVLTYSADTGPAADLAGFAAGSDLLLCEATFQNARRGGPVHLTAEEAATTAVRAGAGALALTHHWPTFDPEVSLAEARAAAGGLPVRLAWSGDEMGVGAAAGRGPR
jgi:ribonuclease BN (tRNA processing enzyme)